MKLDVLIVDDEENARENLQILVREYCPELNIIGLAGSVSQAKIMINEYSPKLVFLDISMPQGDGFSLLNDFDERDFLVIFITAHSEHAFKAFKADAIDFIQKPIDIEELQNAVKKAIKYSTVSVLEKKEAVSSKDEQEKISIPTRNGYIFIENKDIIYLQACENYTEIFLANGKRVISSKTIKRYEEKMNSHIFSRIHKSYIINKHNHLKELSRQNGNFAVMSNGESIPIARRRLSQFLKKII